MSNGNRTCFVVMGFGKKTDFESGKSYDLDKAYQNLIKPAVEAAGLKCIRADEIVHSGLIDVPMYEQLFNADVVVADLSTSNKNAFYELGIRHALRPYTTVVIAEDCMKAPFDVNHVVIRQYHHLGDDIGVSEARRFTGLLSDAIKKILANTPQPEVDSPVYRFVQGLQPPKALPQPAGAPGEQTTLQPGASPTAGTISISTGAVPVAAEGPTSPIARTPQDETHRALMQQVDDAVKREDFIAAKSILSAVRNMKKPADPACPEDPYIVQRLAFLTYQSKHPTEPAALEEARSLLSTLAPNTSNDTETLGLWGAVHKRLWNLTRDTKHLDEAIRAYERGFYLRNDHYNGINVAFLLNVRGAHSADAAEAIADFVLARRIRLEVIDICRAWLAANPAAPATADAEEKKRLAAAMYWIVATLGEALFGTGDPTAQQQLDQAYALAPESWMKKSTQTQVSDLGKLLANSPLQRIH